ncbi:drug:proton antiporter [Sulfitobacter sp. SK012]|uniref:GNAT family N-acetyltransferase n=1 Tax=Sulfitobacter sp. SK012 TaxID=1389005 RepID=UPI000E0AACF1|nr:GNAT family N-acetyltransferase [Sulfitobacter sp. SK012]AXI48627.1 drug:proton antiporter [Sulfitobacter sp. SK012]
MTIRIGRSNDIALCRTLRHIVFVQEQHVPLSDEIDDLDEASTHLIAHDAHQPVGTARITLAGGVAKIGRVCVLPSHRGTGLGAALIRQGLEVATAQGATQAKLGAQTHALGFYEKLGFVATGPVYDDAGIPHRDMVRGL